jgi:predicted methyltransferase
MLRYTRVMPTLLRLPERLRAPLARTSTFAIAIASFWLCVPSLVPALPEIGLPAGIAYAAETIAAAAEDPAREASVKPGINDKYLSPNLDVQTWVERFEGESRQIFNHRNEIAATLGLKPGAVVGDIGAGTGLYTRIFAHQVGKEGTVFAVEISPKFIERLGALSSSEQLPQIQVVTGGDHSTNLPSASIDVAFVCDVYHHFEYPEAMLASLRRALRPDGELVVIDFERIPGKSEDWVVKHVRAGKGVFLEEIQAAGFVLDEEVVVEGLEDNYILKFKRGSDEDTSEPR